MDADFFYTENSCDDIKTVCISMTLLCTVRAILRCAPRGSVNASVSDGLTALHQVNKSSSYNNYAVR